MLIGGSLAGLWLDSRLFYDWLINPWFHLISFLAGVLVSRLVINSSRNTGRQLARLGREGDLPRMQTNKLVTQGHYACMRHPMHLGLMMFPLAAALLVGSVSFLIFIVPMEIIFMIMMIVLVEEPEAIAKFGDDYHRYREKVPMFSFRRQCLRALFAG